MGTIQDMKSGKYGEKAKKFFQENPDGTVDCDNVLFRCRKCGFVKVDKALDLYKPKEFVPELNYPNIYPLVWPGYYEKVIELDHKCERCGDKMDIQNEDIFLKNVNEGIIKCPDCGGFLEESNRFDWD